MKNHLHLILRRMTRPLVAGVVMGLTLALTACDAEGQFRLPWQAEPTTEAVEETDPVQETTQVPETTVTETSSEATTEPTTEDASSDVTDATTESSSFMASEEDSSEATTEESSSEPSEESTEETTEESTEETTEVTTEETTPEATRDPEQAAFFDEADRIYPSAEEILRTPELVWQHFPSTILPSEDEWRSWDEEAWATFIEERKADYVQFAFEQDEPNLEDENPMMPAAMPTPLPEVTPYVPLEVPEQAPDGRSEEALDTPLEIDGIILVNKQHWVSQDYRPLDDDQNIWGLEPEAMAAFKEMSQAAQEEGMKLIFASGYRHYEQQQELFEAYAAKNPDGELGANRGSARPGQSEHQTGLALDIHNGIDGLTLNFADSREGQWLWRNAWRYGWILRYPQGKQHITGYKFEPWHYRYVGKDVAKDFGTYSTLTLEEYLGDTLSLTAWQYDEDYDPGVPDLKP